MELRTETLSPVHSAERFDCGEEALNSYLRRYALQSQLAGAARIYVVSLGAEVIGYYSLSAGSIEPASSSSRISKGLSRHQPIPIVLLGRLAVTRYQQGRGLGGLLLRDAILRFLQAADIIGVRALMVHAKNPKLSEYYVKLGFEPLPANPLHLALLLKDARRTAGF
jgi:predicted N-acetyltransferase YhbS